MKKFLSGGVNVMSTENNQSFLEKLDQHPIPKGYAGITPMELFLDVLRDDNIFVLGLHRTEGIKSLISSKL